MTPDNDTPIAADAGTTADSSTAKAPAADKPVTARAASQPAAAPPPAAAEPAEPEQPVMGGSYERQADGTLKRIEFTKHEAPAADEQEA